MRAAAFNKALFVPEDTQPAAPAQSFTVRILKLIQTTIGSIPDIFRITWMPKIASRVPIWMMRSL
jgi:hypothetical protein